MDKVQVKEIREYKDGVLSHLTTKYKNIILDETRYYKDGDIVYSYKYYYDKYNRLIKVYNNKNNELFSEFEYSDMSKIEYRYGKSNYDSIKTIYTNKEKTRIDSIEYFEKDKVSIKDIYTYYDNLIIINTYMDNMFIGYAVDNGNIKIIYRSDNNKTNVINLNPNRENIRIKTKYFKGRRLNVNEIQLYI